MTGETVSQRHAQRIVARRTGAQRLLAMYAKGRYVKRAKDRPRSLPVAEDIALLITAGYVTIDEEGNQFVVTTDGHKFINDTGPYYGL